MISNLLLLLRGTSSAEEAMMPRWRWALVLTFAFQCLFTTVTAVAAIRDDLAGTWIGEVEGHSVKIELAPARKARPGLMAGSGMVTFERNERLDSFDGLWWLRKKNEPTWEVWDTQALGSRMLIIEGFTSTPPYGRRTRLELPIQSIGRGVLVVDWGGQWPYPEQRPRPNERYVTLHRKAAVER